MTAFSNPPRYHTNFESVAVSCCISILLSTIFKLYQITTAKDNLNKYTTIQHYRNAASHRVTFKKALRMIYSILKKEAEEDGGENDNDENDDPNQQQHQRQRRARFNNNMVPQKMDFASAKTYQTPLKARRRQIERGEIDVSVINRSKTCTGFPCEVLCQDEGSGKKDPRRACYICKAKTKWQCINCRLFFCMSSKKTASAKVNVIISKRKRLSIPTKRQLESTVSPAFMFSMKARFEMFFIEIERLFLIRAQVTRQQSPSLHYHHIKTNHLEGVFIARSYHNILMVRIL